jgi:hypothetical protein
LGKIGPPELICQRDDGRSHGSVFVRAAGPGQPFGVINPDRESQLRMISFQASLMKKLAALFALSCSFASAQTLDRVKEIVDAARSDSPRLKDLLGHGLPEMHGRDGAIVWGQEFLFAVESATPATVAIDYQPPVPMKNVSGTNYWYKLAVLRLGTTHNYNYFAGGRSLGTYDVAGYNPDSYPEQAWRTDSFPK